MFSLFNVNIFGIENEAVVLYVRMASVFIVAVAFILCWYGVNLKIRSDVSRQYRKFATDLIAVDFEKISQNSLPEVSDTIAKNLERYEYCRFVQLGICVPLFCVFFILCVLGIYQDYHMIFAYCVGCALLFLIIQFANAIINLSKISKNQHSIRSVLQDIAHSVKGIQFFNSTEFIYTKLKNAERKYINVAKRDIQKNVWRSFAYICLMFLFIIVMYIANEEYISIKYLDGLSIDTIYLTSLFVFILFLVAFFHCRHTTRISNCDISKYSIQAQVEITEIKHLEFKNLFIAVHGVYFHAPTETSNKQILQNLTFSVLPGEFIAITGDDVVAQRYIFDLLLDFYKPQSGQIYISGKKIETFSKIQIRSIIGIFDEHFGLIRGTVYDNLAMLGNKDEELYNVVQNTGLEVYINNPVFAVASSKLLVSQDILFRIQLARIALRRPKILLINTPKFFQNKEAETMFYEFVEIYSARCTVLIRTQKATPIIYSDKILFLSQGKYLFGSHAELSKDKLYHRFMRSI